MEGIVALIDERGLREGDPLPGTGELATTFNVSIPVIREAIAGLSSIGLLRKQQGRESVVSSPDSTHLAQLLSLRVAGLRVDDESIQQYREIVEVGSAKLAAINRDSNALVELDNALERLRKADNETRLHAADVAFHAAVARAGGNDLLILTLEALEPLLRRHREHVWQGWVQRGGDLHSIVEAHAVVLDAIRRHDDKAAGIAMAEHLEQARAGLTHPADGMGADVDPFEVESRLRESNS